MTSRRIIYSMSYEDDDVFTEQRAYGARQLHIDAIHPTVRGWKVNPAPDVWDFSEVRKSVENIRGQQLLYFPTLGWAPKWASGGFPAYDEYLRGCAKWPDDAIPGDVSRLDFKTSEPWCVNPPHLDPKWSATFAYKLMQDEVIGRSVFAVAPWNEPDGEFYFPPIRSEDRNGDACVRYMEEVAIPMIRGARSVSRRGVQTIGCESAGADFLRRVLEYERDHDLHLFDAPSGHLYHDTADPDSIYRLAEDFFSFTDATRDDRPIAFSENGVRSTPDKFLVFFERLHKLIEERKWNVLLIGIPRAGWWKDGTWEANHPELSELGLELRKMIDAHSSGRSIRMHI